MLTSQKNTQQINGKQGYPIRYDVQSSKYLDGSVEMVTHTCKWEHFGSEVNFLQLSINLDNEVGSR